MNSSIIDTYIEQYKKDFVEYTNLEAQISKDIRSLLRSSGIMGLVTSRIKEPDRLEEKIYKRIDKKQYKNHTDITKDINAVVHGNEPLGVDFLNEHMIEVDKLLKHLKE